VNERIQRTIAEVEDFMQSVDDACALPRAAAEFTHGLVLHRGARRVVEIGTSYGYSGLWIAAALAPGGRMISIDQDARKIERAWHHFDRAGLLDRVEFRHGSALEILHTIEGPVDFVLNDADKTYCVEYVELLEPRLAERAAILTDNTVTHRGELAEFLAWMSRHPGFQFTEMAVGNGMALAVRKPTS
jgi:predicted O-methyltransferase YrrM